MSRNVLAKALPNMYLSTHTFAVEVIAATEAKKRESHIDVKEQKFWYDEYECVLKVVMHTNFV